MWCVAYVCSIEAETINSFKSNKSKEFISRPIPKMDRGLFVAKVVMYQESSSYHYGEGSKQGETSYWFKAYNLKINRFILL